MSTTVSTSVSTRHLFIDMNAFFASVEQQEQPRLRNRPIVVAPVMADTTCAIAASYEAKKLGIKTGTGIREAKKICPEVEVVQARPHIYREYHTEIVKALNDFFVNVRVMSVDEMACRIGHLYRSTEEEARLAQSVKQRIYDRLGKYMRASVGVANNIFLAKVASDIQKPNGLTILHQDNFPQALFKLDLRDLPGIGSGMLVRLKRHNIHTVEALYEAPRHKLRQAWGGVVGERWWHMLRGNLEADYGEEEGAPHKTVSHSHVLGPEFRTHEGSKRILLRLFTKALRRLRMYDQAACRVSVHVRYREKPSYDTYAWDAQSPRHAPANDDMSWIKIVRGMLDRMPPPKPGYHPLQVGIVFTELIGCADVNLNLFEDSIKKTRICRAVDAINERFPCGVDLASVYWLRQHAPYRIAFGRTLLDADAVGH